jgi:hypothetical protein
MVVLATVATVIASQAVISGAFSVSQQAVQIGFLPRLTIRHTSERELGQIYVPAVNAGMLAAVLAIVIGFGSATALANAYGVAVTGTFVLTTILFLAVARRLWHKPARVVALGGAVLLTVEVAFFAGNIAKIAHGGWLPLAIAAVVFTTLMTWHKGMEIVTANRSAAEGSFPDFLEQLGGGEFPLQQVPGVAVFLHRNLGATPLALRANVEHNHVVHDQVIIVSVQTERVPHIPDSERIVTKPKMLYSATGRSLRATPRQRAAHARRRARHRTRHLFPLADHDRAGRLHGHGCLEEEALRDHGPQRRQRGGLLQAPRRSHRHHKRPHPPVTDDGRTAPRRQSGRRNTSAHCPASRSRAAARSRRRGSRPSRDGC